MAVASQTIQVRFGLGETVWAIWHEAGSWAWGSGIVEAAGVMADGGERYGLAEDAGGNWGYHGTEVFAALAEAQAEADRRNQEERP